MSTPPTTSSRPFSSTTRTTSPTSPAYHVHHPQLDDVRQIRISRHDIILHLGDPDLLIIPILIPSSPDPAARAATAREQEQDLVRRAVALGARIVPSHTFRASLAPSSSSSATIFRSLGFMARAGKTKVGEVGDLDREGEAGEDEDILLAVWEYDGRGIRECLRDRYGNGKWSHFVGLVEVIPPGGSLGLDDKLFTFPIDRAGVARDSPHFVRFENARAVEEFSDPRANPRLALESELLHFRTIQLSAAGFGGSTSYNQLCHDGCAITGHDSDLQTFPPRSTEGRHEGHMSGRVILSGDFVELPAITSIISNIFQRDVYSVTLPYSTSPSTSINTTPAPPFSPFPTSTTLSRLSRSINEKHLRGVRTAPALTPPASPLHSASPFWPIQEGSPHQSPSRPVTPAVRPRLQASCSSPLLPTRPTAWHVLLTPPDSGAPSRVVSQPDLAMLASGDDGDWSEGRRNPVEDDQLTPRATSMKLPGDDIAISPLWWQYRFPSPSDLFADAGQVHQPNEHDLHLVARADAWLGAMYEALRLEHVRLAKTLDILSVNR